MSLPADAIERAAATLATLRTGLVPIDELPDGERPGDLEDAYRIQDRLNRRLAVAGWGDEAGAKIGCTTPVMQAYLGIPHPCAGALFATMVRWGEGVFARDGLRRPGVECEIAVVLSQPMAGPAPYTARTAAACVDAAMASIELVDDRWTDFSRVSTPTLIADDFFNAGCVLGPPAPVDPMGLDAVTGAMRIDGSEIGSGTGRDILGHPMEALAWLADHRIALGRPLAAGAVVTLGSVVKTAWIDRGSTVTVTIEGLGGATLRLS